MPFGIGWPELTIILVIVLVIFGAGKVPEIGRALGKGIKEFRSSVNTSPEEDPKAKEAEKAEAASKKN